MSITGLLKMQSLWLDIESCKSRMDNEKNTILSLISELEALDEFNDVASEEERNYITELKNSLTEGGENV